MNAHLAGPKLAQHSAATLAAVNRANDWAATNATHAHPSIHQPKGGVRHDHDRARRAQSAAAPEAASSNYSCLSTAGAPTKLDLHDICNVCTQHARSYALVARTLKQARRRACGVDLGVGWDAERLDFNRPRRR
jgi:hypothetical protein